MVGLEVHHAVRLADLGLALLAELGLERDQERFEHVEDQGAAARDLGGDVGIDRGVDHDRPHPLRFAAGADALGHLARAFDAVDEGDPVGLETRAAELGQQAVANGFGGDTGPIGDVEHWPDR